MKRKSCISAILVFLFAVCLWGCRLGDLAGTGNTQPTDAASPVIGGIPEVEHPGNSLAEYDPDREVYFYCDHMTAKFYLKETAPFFSFYIFSKKPLDIKHIQVEIPCSGYEIYSIYEVEGLRDTQYNAGLNVTDFDQFRLPYYVYQSYCGTDFARIAQLWALYLNPPAEGSEEAEAAVELTGGKAPYAAYEELQNAYMDSYMALEPEDTREFYVYCVVVVFTGNVEETIQEMDVIIDGKIYYQNIGEICLIPSEIPHIYPYVTESKLHMDGAAVQANPVNTYGNGMGAFLAFTFTAQADMTLTDFYFLDDITKLLDIEMTVTSGGNTVSYSWNGDSPVYLYEGDKAVLYVRVQNSNMTGLHYDTELYYALDMTINGGNYCLNHYVQMVSHMNFHEIYAIVFDGLDMEPYYRDYYYPVYEAWRENYENQ